MLNFTTLDTWFEEMDVIDIYSSIIWNDRYTKCGDFELVTDMSQRIQTYQGLDTYLRSDRSDHIMVFETQRIKSSPENGIVRTFSGRSLESILDRRIIWNQLILTGSLQDGIETILNENIISPTDSARAMANFVFDPSTDPAITSLEVDAQYYGENVYTAIQKLCETSGIGFKITISPSKEMVFKLYAGIDRSKKQTLNPLVLFTPDHENLRGTEYYEDRGDQKNSALVAGEGEGSDRIVTEAYRFPTDEGTELDFADRSRREIFVDAASVSRTTNSGQLTLEQYTLQLQERGWDELSKRPFVRSFEGEIEDSGSLYTIGVDFDLGDIVQIEDEFGHSSNTRVEEIILNEDNNGRRIYPKFGALS